MSENKRDYPLYKLIICKDSDEFGMRSTQLSAAGWTLESWQVVWPEGRKPVVACVWTKANSAVQAAVQKEVGET